MFHRSLSHNTATMTMLSMVFLTVFVLITSSQANGMDYSSADQTIFRTLIDDALSQLRDIILNGDPDRGIPVLDPLEVEKWEFAVHEPPAVQAEGALSDVLLQGLGAFVAEEPKIQTGPVQTSQSVTLGLRLPALSALGKYELSGEAHPGAADVSLDAQGNYTAIFQDIYFKVKLKISLISSTIKSVDVTLGLGDVYIDVQGAGEVGDLINNEAADRVQQWFVENRSQMEQQIAEIIKEVVVETLS